MLSLHAVQSNVRLRMPLCLYTSYNAASHLQMLPPPPPRRLLLWAATDRAA
jgi:hypothetical protein